MGNGSGFCVGLWRRSFRGEVQELLLVTQNSDSTLVEAVWILLGGDVKIDGEDEVGPGEVQVDGQSHLRGDKEVNR